MRYYVYSIEFGFPPWDYYHDTDDREEAIIIASDLSKKNNVTVYVVDREPATMYQEIFVSISSDFNKSYRRR
jgi:nitrogen regulatory protein PII-like uncharacterized protein